MGGSEPDGPASNPEPAGPQEETAPPVPGPIAEWSEKYREKYYKQVDEMFFRTEGYAESAFRTNTRINVIVVALGMVMILYAILQSAVRGTTFRL